MPDDFDTRRWGADAGGAPAAVADAPAVPPAPMLPPMPDAPQAAPVIAPNGMGPGASHIAPDLLNTQTTRWQTPYDRQIANDLASGQAELEQAGQLAEQSRQTNAQLARSRQAVQAATEFVRRKETERMVRDGMSLEDAEFKSRVKYNTANAAQLNALRPVPPPALDTIDGVAGVRTGTRGQNWKPLNPQAGAIKSREKIAAEGNALKQKLQDERLSAAAKNNLNRGFDLLPHMELNRYNVDIKEAMLEPTEQMRTNALKAVDAKWQPKIDAMQKAKAGGLAASKAEPAPKDPKDRVEGKVYMTPKGPHKWMGKHWNTVDQ